MQPIQTVALLGRAEPQHAEYLASIVELIQAAGRRAILADAPASVLGARPASPASVKKADLIIAFGGDGTLLRAICQLAGTRAAFFGVKLVGTLGFLTGHSPADLPRHLGEFFAGNYQEGPRFMLAVEVIRGRKKVHKLQALNEVVIHQNDTARMLRLPLRQDDQLIANFLADGVLVATPTGSTAYSLSAGGPIVFPSQRAFIVTPVAPHLLTNRPLVLPPDRVLTAEITQPHLRLTADGQNLIHLHAGDTVRIRGADWSPNLIFPANSSYFETLRDKLNWGERSAS